MIDIRDPIRAITLLTRLPVPGGDGDRMAEAAWAWPLVGLLVGGVQMGVGLAALALGLPPAVAAGLAIALGLLMTGGLHEDGFADCADGFWGGHTRARRLEILKDSRIGAYGVLALIVGIGLKWALFATLLPIAPLSLIAGAMLGRAAMAVLMGWMPFARAGGLAAYVGRPSVAVCVLGVGVAIIGAVLSTGGSALLAVLATALAAAAIARLAQAKIGGQTGDVLGAAQVTGEIAALLTLAALIT